MKAAERVGDPGDSEKLSHRISHFVSRQKVGGDGGLRTIFMATSKSYGESSWGEESLELRIWIEFDEMVRYFEGSNHKISSPNKIQAYWPGPNWPAAHLG